MSDKSPRISLCMIVRDEADWIQQCLSSVRSIICEAIVVDTGSTDATIEIATRCGATVIPFQWCDDFAAARNFSLTHARGDWILVLDADEMLAPSDLETLVALTAQSSTCFELTQRHYTDDHRVSNFTPLTGEFPEIERGQIGYFESRCVRFFPNHGGLHFVGKVHELVEHSIRLNPDFSVVDSKLRIHHFGHTLAVKQKRNKSKLYHTLGKEKTLAAPQDWKNFFELGVECNCAGRLHEAAKAFVRSIELNPAYLPTWTNLGYVFCELGQFEAALDALTHATKLDPRCAEAFCNLGVALMRLQRYPEAERVLMHALALNPKYINVICNLAETLAQMGRFSEAAFNYRRALELAPGCAVALADLGALYLQAGLLEHAEPLLRQAVDLPSVKERARYNLELLLSIPKQAQEAAAAVSSIADQVTNSEPVAESPKDGF